MGLNCEPDLPKLVLAGHGPRRFAGRLHRWQQQPDQRGEDRASAVAAQHGRGVFGLGGSQIGGLKINATETIHLKVEPSGGARLAGLGSHAMSGK